MTATDRFVDEFLQHHFAFRPVDASFMGITGHDHRLPPADAEAPAREAAGLAALRAELDALEKPAGGGAALDHGIADSHLRHAARELAERPRFRDPCWYTSEAVFALVSLLLPSAAAPSSELLEARLAGIPRFLEEGRAHLRGAAVCADWVERARREARATLRFLGGGLRRHPLWRDGMAPLAEAAAAALAEFEAALDGLPDADPRSGGDYLRFILREVHQISEPLESVEARAAERFARLDEELAREAAKLDPEHSWAEQLARFDEASRVPAAALADTYRRWHERGMEAASGLLTPATEYGLEFRPMPDWAAEVFADTYFLAYRSPPAAHPGTGSIYWVTGAGQPLSGIKQTHAIHHASIGHHTHNARARVSPSRLARLAEAGCPRGVGFLSAGTSGEGWACYAQALTAEMRGFLESPVERELQLREIERRNIACLLADIRLHTGRWTLEEMRRFYAGEGGFPAGRIWGESTRNSIFPGTRLMYWLGTEAIRDGRRRWNGSVRDYHDAVMARGHATIGAVLDDVARDVA
ncbi:DUF885 family protein [Roseomonas sp. BN140053]|uniref:DUF885 family protein n=1 Tax=Roseomonas sp. BN140053 TaxID=3391898 RepID=UPI0039E941C4